MTEKRRSSPTTESRREFLRPKVLVPVAAGLALLVGGVLLLCLEQGQAHLEAPPLTMPKPARLISPGDTVHSGRREEPLRPPPAVEKGPVSVPAGTGPNRWALQTLPAGWDPALAAHLASVFETMDVSDHDPEKLGKLLGAREALEKFLRNLGPEALPTLGAILGAEPDFVNRRFVLRAIGDLGPKTEDATFVLHQFYLDRRGQPGARSETNYVIEAMGRLKNDSAFSGIRSFIEAPETPNYDRDKFVQALGDHPRAIEALPQFLHEGNNNQDIGTRNHSWQAIGKQGPKAVEALGALISAWERETAYHVRQTILGSIGKLGDARALPALERIARTATPSSDRLSAARAIFRLGTPAALNTLRALIPDERDAKLQTTYQGWLDTGK